jgi:hypothetical protein
MYDDKKLYFEIRNINLLKILVDVLDKTTEDIRWNFSNILDTNKKKISPKNDLSVITCTNNTKNCFIKTKFNSQFISKLYLEKSNLEVLVNVKKILNILKSVDKSDTLLKFYINKNSNLSSDYEFNSNSSCDIMIIEISANDTNENDNSYNTDNSDNSNEINNLEKKKIAVSKSSLKKKISKDKKFQVDILYPLQPEKPIAKITFDKKIMMDNNKFHKTCKDLGILFDFVKISSKNNKLVSFCCDNNNCDGFNSFKYDDDIKLENLNEKLNTANGIYSLEDINNFSKLSDITTEFYFQIKNNFVLECNYKFDTYGSVDIIYVPIKDDDIKNVSNLSVNTNIENFDNLSNLSNISNINNLETKSTKIKKTIDDKIIYLEIDQIEIFKLLCECTEKITSEPLWTIDFPQNKNPSIHVTCNNNSKNINIDYVIKNIFSQYKNLDKQVELGIDLDKLNDILKTVDKTNKLILSIDKNDKHNLSIQIKNKEKINHRKIYKIKLLNVENTNIELRKDSLKKIIIDSNEFYKIAKEINSIGEIIKLECSNKHICFSCMEESKYLNMYKKNSDTIKITGIDKDKDVDIDKDIDKYKNKESESSKIVIGAYEIKDIMIFSKLVNFMQDFKINLSVDGMMTIQSDFVSVSKDNDENPLELGSIKIQYSSKTKEEIPINDIGMIESDVETTDDKLLFFKLKKISFVKTIIDTIDKLVSDVDWVFTSNNKKNKDSNNFIGLEIVCTDPSKTLYVKTKLNDLLFKSYYCKKDNFRFGMGLEFFNKILKLTDKNDVAIYCYIEDSDPDNMVIRFKNPEKKNKKIFKIPLQILNPQSKPPITLDFEKKITIDGNKFHDICKKISNTSQFIEIECYQKHINFKSIGDDKGTIPFDETNDSNFKIVDLDESMTKGIYEIKNILLFSKLISIIEDFSIFMKNNFALTSVYSFGDLGSIITILSPVNEEHINNISYDYSDDEDDVELIKSNGNMLDFF